MKYTPIILPFIILLISITPHQNLHCAALEPVSRGGIHYGTRWAQRAVWQATQRAPTMIPRRNFASQTTLNAKRPVKSPLIPPVVQQQLIRNAASALEESESSDKSEETPPDELLSMEPPLKGPPAAETIVQEPQKPATPSFHQKIRNLLRKPKTDKPMPSIHHPRYAEEVRIQGVASSLKAAEKLEEAQKRDEAYEQEHAHYSVFNKIYAAASNAASWFKQKWNNWNKKPE